MHYFNTDRIIAAQITTREENPLLTEDSCFIDVWFEGHVVRRQLFKKITKAEQELFVSAVAKRGFIRSGNLFIDPGAVLYAEMENRILGGIITIGWQENGKPMELKVSDKSFDELHALLNSR